MKQLLFFLITIFSTAACNNDKAPTVEGAGAETAKATAKAPAETGCSSFLWFKEGTTMEYSLTDATGKAVGTTTTHIDKVHPEGTATVADFTTSYAGGKNIKASYRCEGDKIYMNMKTFFDNNFSGMKKAGVEMEMGDAYLSFPWNMKPGDKLDGADLIITAKKAGKDFMTMKSSIKDRTVEAVEKITTPAGTWDCLKLVETRTNTSSMMGRQIMSSDAKTIEWFVPGAGLVKFETYDAAGKLQTRSELISIK
jgi:hypothetical protein